MEKIVHDPASHRFLLPLDGEDAFVEYADQGSDTLDLLHTVVPPSAQGQGHGSALVEQVLHYAREHNKQIVPTCAFVKNWLQDHPEYQDVVKT